MKKVLMICTRFPYPADGGDKLRVTSNIHFLKKKNYKIDLCYIGYKKIKKNIKIKDVNEIYVFNLKKIKSFFLILINLFSKDPFQVNLYYQKDIAKKIEKTFKRKKYDFIIFHLLRTVKYKNSFINRNNYLDCSDSLILNYKRLFRKIKLNFFAYFYIIEIRKLIKFYSDNYSNFKKIFYISNFDLRFDRRILNLKNNSKLITLNRNNFIFKRKNLYDSQSKNILFIANFNSISNLLSAYKNFLLENILKKKNKKIKIYYCGKNSILFKVLMMVFNKKKNYIGNIENLLNLKIKFKLGLANLIFSSGFQNKIINYLKFNLPCLISREVSYGFNKKDRKIFKIYSSSNELNKIISEILINKKKFLNKRLFISSNRTGKF